MKKKREDALKIIRQAKDGSQSAFDTLLQQYGRLIIYHCIQMMGNRADGEDAAQEVFILLHKNIRRLNSTEAFSVWLHKLIRHTCIRLRSGVKNKMDSQNISLGIVEDSLTETKTNMIPEAYLANVDKRETLLYIVSDLPDKMRECVLLYYYEDLPVKQIAQIIDTSENAVNVMLHRARVKIRTEIERQDVAAYSFALLPFGAITEVLKTDALQTVSATTVDMCIKSAGFGNASKRVLLSIFSWAVPLVATIGVMFLLMPTQQTLSSPKPVNAPQHIVAQGEVENDKSTPDTQQASPAPIAMPKEGSTITTIKDENVIVGVVYLDDPVSPKGRTWKSVPGATVQAYSADGTTPVSEAIQVDEQNSFRLQVDTIEQFRVLVTVPQGVVFATNLSDITPLPNNSQKAWLVYNGQTVLSFAENINITGLKVVAYRPAKLTGSIMAESDCNLSGLTVDLLNSEGRIVATVITDANGHYILENPPVASAGQYRVSLRFPLPYDLLSGEDQSVFITPGKSMELPSLSVSPMEDVYNP